MAAYKVCFRESVEKDFRVIPKKDLKRILRCIEALAKNSWPSGCEKLTAGRDIVFVKADTGSCIPFRTRCLPSE